MQFSPSIKPNDVEHLYKVYNYGMQTDLDLFEDFKDKLLSESLQNKYPKIDILKDDWNALWKDCIDYRKDNTQDANNLESQILWKFYEKYRSLPVGNGARSFEKE